MQLERMFFIWTLPHTSVPLDPLVFIPPESVHNVILSNHHMIFFFIKVNHRITFLDKHYCNTALPELASLSMCDGSL